MFATLSLGWNIIGGYTGYVSFGNVVFFGLGAYTTAALWQHWHQQNLLLAVVVAMADRGRVRGRPRASRSCACAATTSASRPWGSR